MLLGFGGEYKESDYPIDIATTDRFVGLLELGFEKFKPILLLHNLRRVIPLPGCKSALNDGTLRSDLLLVQESTGSWSAQR